ncbi:MAG TPA: nuclear transport factor 2 family protein [Ideonella sp.]|nr:nuclear transport factor 2 family protein [Ideonella sp.]
MNDPLSTVQSAYACFGQGDIAGLLRHLSADVEWQFVGDAKARYTGRFSGHGQVGEMFAEVARHDDIQLFEPRQFLAGPDHVTVLGFERTRDRDTGREFACEWVHVWQLREGLVTRFWGMLDTAASLATRP